MISSEYDDHLLKGFIYHDDCAFDNWGDIDGTIVQKCDWESLKVDKRLTYFNKDKRKGKDDECGCGDDFFNSCPAGKFIYSLFRDNTRLD